jgi:hypothetical protein
MKISLLLQVSVTLMVLSLNYLNAFSQENLDIITLDNGVKCGLRGTARPGSDEYDYNFLKNRYRFPKKTDINKSIQLEDFLKGGPDKNRFSEKQAAEIVGYVFFVKPGSIESCNCGATHRADQDTHIEIMPIDSESSKKRKIIVEVTPRIREIMLGKGRDWSTASLKRSIEHQYVKIQGWLFYDGEHEKESFSYDPTDSIGKDNWRATCWEIHPVTEIEKINR